MRLRGVSGNRCCRRAAEREQHLAGFNRSYRVHLARGQRNQGPGSELHLATCDRHGQASGDRLDDDLAIRLMLLQHRTLLEDEQNHRHRPLADKRDLLRRCRGAARFGQKPGSSLRKADRDQVSFHWGSHVAILGRPALPLPCLAGLLQPFDEAIGPRVPSALVYERYPAGREKYARGEILGVFSHRGRVLDSAPREHARLSVCAARHPVTTFALQADSSTELS